jgi:hypothetical protein
VSRDFTRVAFNSNWGAAGDDIDDYIIHIPSSALPGGTTTTKPSHVTGGNSQPMQAPSGSRPAASPGASIRVTGGDTSTSGNSTSARGDGSTMWVSPGERLLRRAATAARRTARSLAASRRLRAALLAVPSVAWWHSAFEEEDDR